MQHPCRDTAVAMPTAKLIVLQEQCNPYIFRTDDTLSPYKILRGNGFIESPVENFLKLKLLDSPFSGLTKTLA